MALRFLLEMVRYWFLPFGKNSGAHPRNGAIDSGVPLFWPGRTGAFRFGFPCGWPGSFRSCAAAIRIFISACGWVVEATTPSGR